VMCADHVPSCAALWLFPSIFLVIGSVLTQQILSSPERAKKRRSLLYFHINHVTYNSDKLFGICKKHNFRTHIGDCCTRLTCRVSLTIVLHSIRHMIIASCFLSTLVPTDYRLAQSVDSVSARNVSTNVCYDMNADTLHLVSFLHLSSVQAFKLCLWSSRIPV
jgi:hypothetical protein